MRGGEEGDEEEAERMRRGGEGEGEEGEGEEDEEEEEDIERKSNYPNLKGGEQRLQPRRLRIHFCESL